MQLFTSVQFKKKLKSELIEIQKIKYDKHEQNYARFPSTN
jgi:hypothetical protein